ncbi:hypothetical protein [Klebsiella pneumoniae]|uniref:hypothetical protein n=1 Tax=Klebsiella pneumoniae TaxID=573 RepID=UPI001D0F1751|nr:hypothetical protein [Klebsiella pneumoniae]
MLNNASAATVQAPPYTSERQRTLATLVVSIALVLEIIDVSIINVAIPVVQRDLLASPRQIEWVVTGYLFFFSILLLTGGCSLAACWRLAPRRPAAGWPSARRCWSRCVLRRGPAGR